MTYRDAVLADAPVAYWPLDDYKYGGIPTQARDEGPSGLHAAPQASYLLPAKMSGPTGLPAMWFNGANTGLIAPGSATLDLQTFTIEAWIKPVQMTDGNTNAAQSGFIYEKTTNGLVNTQYAMFLEGNFMIGRQMTGPDYTGGPGSNSLTTAPHDMEANGRRWRHISYSRRASDGYALHSREGVGWWDSTFRGNVLGTVPSGGGAAGTSFIGCYGGGGYRVLGGIAHVAVYPTFLTQAQLQAHVRQAALDAVSY